MERKFNIKNIQLDTVHRIRQKFEIAEDIFEQDLSFDHYQTEISLLTAINEKSSMLRLRLATLLKGQSKSNEPFPVTGDFCFDFHFKVKQLKNFATIENNELILDHEMMRILSSISYSTSRGFIMNETDKSGILPCAILPIIDPSELLTGRVTSK